VRTLALALLGLALGAAPAAAAAPPVTLDGWHGVRPGMSVAEVERRLGVELALDAFPGSPCSTAALNVEGARGYALFMNRRLGSLWFRRGVATDRGVRIGSSFQALREAYPTLRVRQDRYEPRARNVFVRRAQAPHWRLRFDVAPAGRITWIAFGNDTVFLVEGCA
jgi:hypothetical protein